MAKAPFVPLPGTATVEMRYILDGQHVENVYHFDCGGLTADKAAAIADFMVNHFEFVTAKGVRGNFCTWDSITIRDASVEDGPVYTPTPRAPFNGSAPGAALPNSCTLAIKMSTGLGGRSFRGRSYWIGLTEGQATANTVDAAVASTLVAVMNELLTPAAVTACGHLVVASKRHNNEWRLPVGVVTPVTNFSITDRTIDNQRRRLPSRGR